MDDFDIPETFREVGIYLRDIKRDQTEIRTEMSKMKEGQSKLLTLIFTAIIAPIIVGIIVGYVLATSR